MTTTVQHHIDLGAIPLSMRALASGINLVVASDCIEKPDAYGNCNYSTNTITVYRLGIEKGGGLLRIFAHELAHNYCYTQRGKKDNRFLREFAKVAREYSYYLSRRRFGSDWILNKGVVEAFCYEFSEYIIGGILPKLSQCYFEKWFPLEVNNDY